MDNLTIRRLSLSSFIRAENWFRRELAEIDALSMREPPFQGREVPLHAAIPHYGDVRDIHRGRDCRDRDVEQVKRNMVMGRSFVGEGKCSGC